MPDAPAWFVVPVVPGLLSQIAGYFKGSSGTYKVIKTFVGHPLYNQYIQAGYGPPYNSYAAAAAAAAQFAKSGRAHALPGAGFGSIPPGAGPTLGNPLAGIADIGDFFHRLTEKQTWVRVGEVAVGGILLFAGVKALASGTTAGSVAKTATKPVKSATKTAASVAAPEFRLARRVAAKKVAPKTTARVAAHRAQVRQYGAKRPWNP